MRKIGILVIIGLLITTSVYAVGTGLVRRNASPVTVSLSNVNQSEEITFPFETRELIITNYDADSGIWVNFRGNDTDGVSSGVQGNRERYYIGPDKTISIREFGTKALTIISDNTFSGGGLEASPVTVLGIF
jgi:hypothetical protein